MSSPRCRSCCGRCRPRFPSLPSRGRQAVPSEVPLNQAFWVLMFTMYLITIAIETPILLIGLSSRHSYGRRLFCGAWLTACTYPVVWLVLPALIDTREQRWLYLLVAESFAPIAECAIFWAAFGTREQWGTRSMWRDLAVITLANLASFRSEERRVGQECRSRWSPD